MTTRFIFRCRTLLLGAVLLFFASTILMADEESDTAKLPEFNEGDKIYFRISESHIEDADNGVLVDPIVKVFELKEKSHTSLNADDFLIVDNPGFQYQIDAQKDKKAKSFQVVVFQAKDILSELKENTKKQPEDRSKWTTTVINGKHRITLAFTGIQRFYQLDGVDIPKGSSLHFKPPYKDKTTTPWLCVCIDRNGIPMRPKGWKSEGTKSNSAGWTATFPASKMNEWEIREWSDDEYMIRLRDINTTFYEVSLLGVPEIRGNDFRETIYEKLGPDEDKTTAVKFRFSPIKQK